MKYLTIFALLAPVLAKLPARHVTRAKATNDPLYDEFKVMEEIMKNIDTADLDKRQSGGCPSLELYFWAGTGESGAGTVGRALSTALTSAVPGSKFVAVDYNTSAEYASSVRTAATAGARTIESRASACPNTKFALSGYSKGALVVHGISLSANVKSRVAAIAVFGDPALRGGSQALPINNSKCVFSYCNTGDIFCSKTPTSITPHLAYPRDGSTTKAAQGIASCSAAGGSSGGSPAPVEGGETTPSTPGLPSSGGSFPGLPSSGGSFPGLPSSGGSFPGLPSSGGSLPSTGGPLPGFPSTGGGSGSLPGLPSSGGSGSCSWCWWQK